MRQGRFHLDVHALLRLAMLTRRQLMNGRWFDERQLEAHIATGSEKFKKSNEKTAGLEDEDDDEGGRLENFGSWLEADK